MSTTFRSIMHTWDGQVIVQERPVPDCRDHFVLVDNRFSTISPGTHCKILRQLRQRQDPAAGTHTPIRSATPGRASCAASDSA